jgi:hypothetical protein
VSQSTYGGTEVPCAGVAELLPTYETCVITSALAAGQTRAALRSLSNRSVPPLGSIGMPALTRQQR